MLPDVFFRANRWHAAAVGRYPLNFAAAAFGLIAGTGHRHYMLPLGANAGGISILGMG